MSMDLLDGESSNPELEPDGDESSPRSPRSESRAWLPRPGLGDEAGEKSRAFASIFEAMFERPATQMLGRYVVLGTLGHGGMGTVYEAYDRTLDRKIAVKVLRSGLSGGPRRWLLREAKALAKLSHPNVVQVYEVGEVDERPFVAMELVNGRTLRKWANEVDRRSWRECVEVYAQAGEGLAAAHSEGMIHLDFKPSNCIIDRSGRVRVLDFGLARANAAMPSEDGIAVTMGDERNETDELGYAPTHTKRAATDAVLVAGTPPYMSVEQLEGASLDARSDQFSYCVALYEALYGERPFRPHDEGTASLEDRRELIVNARIQPAPGRTNVPDRLRRVLVRGLAASADDRWPSMHELLAELRRLVAPRRRRWWWVGGGLGAGLVALGLGLSQYAAVGFRCEGARAELSGAWDDERRDEVRGALLQTGLPYATSTWERVEAELDAYSDGWVTKHVEVCEATRVAERQTEAAMDLRMSCLSDRRLALRETVAVLARGNASTLERAVNMASGLPSLSRCDDVEALRAVVAPPDDPDAVRQISNAREVLALSAALHRAADYHAAEMEADRVLAVAEETGYEPLKAEALYRRGIARQGAAKSGPAEADLREAYRLAARHHHSRIERLAAASLTIVIGNSLSRNDAGEQWGFVALALAQRAGVEPEAEAEAHYGLGAVSHVGQDFARSREHFERSIEILEPLSHGSASEMLGKTLTVLARTLIRQGEVDEAVTLARRGLALVRARLGPLHPDVADSMNTLGIALAEAGRYAEARKQELQALAVVEEGMGPNHPRVGYALGQLGKSLQQAGHFQEALRYHERALAIFLATEGEKSVEVASVLTDMAMNHGSERRFGECLSCLERAYAIQLELLGPDHIDLAFTLGGMGSVLGEVGEFDRSVELLERAIEITQRVYGERHPEVADFMVVLVNVLVTYDENERGLEVLQQAMSILEETVAPNSPKMGEALDMLADLRLRLGDIDEARVIAERALEIMDANADVLAEVQRAGPKWTLARALWPELDQRPRARAMAEQALHAMKGSSFTRPESITEVEQWLAEHPAPS